MGFEYWFLFRFCCLLDIEINIGLANDFPKNEDKKHLYQRGNLIYVLKAISYYLILKGKYCLVYTVAKLPVVYCFIGFSIWFGAIKDISCGWRYRYDCHMLS